ncbi:ABC transporter, ATP-binding protein [Streptomyces sp. e14]|nr:ABC transporter, ATP-binding protein [Streptomyces sp. e14]
MISATGIELRAGARILIENATFRVAKGDRIGLVGRNGAGKTTLTKCLAGEGIPAAGTITRSGEVGYLPQDPRTGDLDVLARDRILSARGLDVLIRKMRENEQRIANGQGATREKALRQYERQETEFLTKGGYAAEAEAATIAAALNLPDRVLGQPLHTLSGGQRRRIELARILFSDADTLLLDEPTNHLDADSIVWLRDYLKTYRGGFIVISHDVDLVETVVNKVFYLDANRSQIDVYNMGWKLYQQQREADEKRRKRERANAEKKGRRAALPGRQDARQGHQDRRRAEHGPPRRQAARGVGGRAPVPTRSPSCASPSPRRAAGRPLMARGACRSRTAPLEIFTDVDLAIDKGSRVVILGLNGAGKTTLLRLLGGVEKPDTGQVVPGHGLKLGYYAQEHETLDPDRTVLENMRSAAPDMDLVEVRKVLGSFLFSGDDVDKPAGVLSGGEKTRLALATLVVSSANVLLLDEPTNNLDPASREEILGALRTYKGAVVLVTHDEGAVEALQPERIILLPDGVEDLWGADYADLVALA